MILDQANKRQTTGEIIVTLFEYCNLSCKFCNQDHDSMEGVKTITSKIDQIKQLISKKDKEFYSIHLMGGEVFADGLSTSTVNDYQYLCHRINEYSIDNDIKIEICFTTNMVWERTARVKTLLDITGAKLITSYDPSGRFNKETFKIFKERVIEFTPYLKSVNVIMTKPTIRKFMSHDIPFFSYLYSNFDTYFDYYTPEKNMGQYLPNDVELRDFMLHMLKCYPEALPFADYRSKIKKKMSCMDTITIMPDGSHGACTILLKDFKKPNVSKQQMEQEWFEQYNCLTCQHFQYCSMGCFLSNHMQSFRTQEACWLSEVYDVVHANT